MAAQKLKRKSPDSGPKETKRTKTDASSQKVRLADLKWQEVSLPDQLEDYEGFFGLEEIDGVDVVRDEATGMVSVQHVDEQAKVQETVDAKKSAKTAAKTAANTAANAGKKDNSASKANGSAKSEISPDEEEDDFHGFSDEDQVSKPVSKGAKAKAKAKASKGFQRAVDDKATTTFTNEDNDEQPAKEVDISAWRSLNLSPDTLSSLSRMGFSTPSPIQAAAIPQIISGHDVIGKASTGSGKTLAFGIPLFETFLENAHKPRPKSIKDSKTGFASKPPTALILSPTRELAHQISAHLADLSKGLPSAGPSIAVLTGGLALPKQLRLLKTADFIIGTPGRIWDIISNGQGVAAWLQQIQYLVLDEADRLLGQGHFKELEEILNSLDRKEVSEVNGVERDDEEDGGELSQRQTLVFSATFHKGLQQKLASKRHPAPMDAKESMEYLLAKLKFREEKPKYIDVDPVNQMASGLKEGLVECGGTEKDLYLYSILLLRRVARSLIFVNSIAAVRRITPLLQNLGLNALPLHSQMPQKARLRSIERFTDPSKASQESKMMQGKGGALLIATDVAARGLDVPNVQLIVHYHLPRAADTYVHRSGRTARAGETGSSILICGPEEVAGVRRLIAKVHAHSSRAESNASSNYIRSLNIDRRVVARLKERVSLAKQLADVSQAKEKKNVGDPLFREAAEDLGVDYDSDEFKQQAGGGGKRGRGAGRRNKEMEASKMGKDEVRGLRAQLNALLQQRVNVGVSERYPSAELLKQRAEGKDDFLGVVDGLGLDDP